MIPKVIHYCWFGGRRKPKLVRVCISSWKKYLPDYKIVEWNEKNTDLTHPFVKEAYHLKKWAFVADYIRLQILYEFGGIYLDTDMMLLKNIDNLLYDDCFFGAEDNNYINGAIIGAIPKNDFIKNIKDFYDCKEFNLSNLLDLVLPRIVTKVFYNYSLMNKGFNEIIKCKTVTIYPQEYFYPLPFENRYQRFNYKKHIKIESYAIHLWEGSWLTPPNFSEFDEIRNGNYLKGLKKVSKEIFKKRITFKYIRKILSSFKQSFKFYV